MIKFETVVSGLCRVTGSKGKDASGDPRLEELGGLYDDENLSDYFGSDESCLIEKGVTGGQMGFFYSQEGLRVVSAYLSDAELTDVELEVLKQYTIGQWADGAGEGFEQRPQYVGNKAFYISACNPFSEVTVSKVELYS